MGANGVGLTPQPILTVMTASEKQVVFDRTVAKLVADRRETGPVVEQALKGIRPTAEPSPSGGGDNNVAEFVSDLESAHYSAGNPLQLVALLDAVAGKHGVNGEATDMVVAWKK